MELVYLWVEDYKNIQNQGFNFSPRFECKYDEVTNKLTIDENKEYVSIFPNNINVTAIVGENGSGKSSLLEILILLFFESKNHKIKKKNWLIFYDKINKILDIKSFQSVNIRFNDIKINSFELFSSSIDQNNKEKYFHAKNFQNNIDFYNIYYNPSLELVSSEFLDHCSAHTRIDSVSMYDIDFKPQDSLNLFSFPSKKNKIIDIQKNNNSIILNMYKSIKILDEKKVDLKYILHNLGNDKIDFIPKRVSFSFDLNDVKYQIKKEDFKDIVSPKYDDLTINSLYAYFIIIVLSISHSNGNKLNTYFFENDEVTKYLQNKLDAIKEKDPENDRVDSIFQLAKYILDNIEEFKNMLATTGHSLGELITEQGKRLNIVVYDIACLLDTLNSFEDKNILINSLSNKGTIIKILPVLPSFIKLDAIDEKGIHFSNFSSGEKNIINIIYSSVYYSLLFSNKNNYINLFIDEMEIGLNPKWQKDVFSIILKFFTGLNINICIYITSHSPFLLSDLPKENVIFLEKGKQVDVDIETFGANIHTLLSHGFFMKDGLIGEFAKGKINETIKFLNKEESEIKTEKEAKNIIDKIGEPFLKEKLRELYDTNYPPSTEERIQRLQEQIKELENANS